MKKQLFLIPFAAFVLASCSNESPVNPGISGDENGNVYLSLGLMNADNSYTRADSDGLTSGNFEDGTDAENAVNKVRFYFFTNTGEKAPVNYVNSTSINYYDYTPGTSGVTSSPSINVSAIVNATIVLKTADLDPNNMPAYIMAVINPIDPAGSILGANQNLASFKSLVANYMPVNGSFMMTNSTYLNGNGNLVCEQPIADANFCSTIEEALANPVNIYVERVVAKVRLSTKELEPVSEGSNIYSTGESFNGNPIYVKFNGWNVTTTADRSYLNKSYDSQWNNARFGWLVNVSDFYRSFWAKNPTGINLEYTSFNEQNAANASLPLANVKDFGTNNYTYLQENAGDPTTGLDPKLCYRSQVIIAGQLVDASGNPIPLAEYALVKYKQSDINQVVYEALGQKIYKDVEGTRTPINPASDIIFKTQNALVKAGAVNKRQDPDYVNGTGTYLVYPQLNGTGFYLEGGTDDATSTLNENFITDVGPVKIWNGGNTYYYLDIEHLNTAATTNDPQGNVWGKYGVVRNHVYNIDINALTGLGTPVYDPKEEIIPEKPGEDYGAVAAQINILSWRVVSQEASLEW